MGCGLSTPILTNDGTAPAQAQAPAPQIDEIKGNGKSHKRSQSYVCSNVVHETDPLIEAECVPGRKSVSGRLESIEEGEQRFSLDMKETIENLKEGRSESVGVGVGVGVPEEKNEERQQDEREEERDGSELGPGSPSFREYCIHPTDTSVDLDQFNHSKSDEQKKQVKHRRRHSIASTEGSNTMLMKKEHKSGRFKRVIPKGGQAAVKTLLNVTACYCPNPHPHSHLSPVTST